MQTASRISFVFAAAWLACVPAAPAQGGSPPRERPAPSASTSPPNMPAEHWGRWREGLAAGERGDFALAAAHFTLLANAYPDNARTWMELGWALANSGRPAEGIEALDRAARLAARDARTHYLRGWVLVSLGRYPEATAAYRWSLELDAGGWYTHYELGRTLGLIARDPEKRSMLPEAISHVREAIRLHPRVASFHDELANLLGMSGRFNEAVTQLSEAIRLEPANANFWHNLGAQQHHAGRFRDAVLSYEQALRLDPPRAGREDFRRCLEAARKRRPC